MSQPKRNTKQTPGTALPPQFIDHEESVLGAVILMEECYYAVADLLKPDIFYKEQNAKVCQAIVSIKNRGEHIDIITVVKELKSCGELDNVGGAYYVESLTDRPSNIGTIETHIRTVIEAWIKREAIRSATVLIKNAYDPTSDSFDIIDEYERNLTSITSQLFTTKPHTMSSLLDDVVEQNNSIVSSDHGITGVPAGFTDLDNLTGGWQKTDMIVLAARPGMGKTGLVIQFGTNAAKAGRPTAIFSLEMSALQLAQRIVSQETEIPLDIVSKKGMDHATLNLFYRDTVKLKGCPLHIDDTGGLSIFELRNRARKLKREEKIELIIIDYLQLMSGSRSGMNREQEVSEISRGIKALAKELKIPIIALSQLSRESENSQGGDKTPKLRHLRDSGSIEQDADMVMFIYRPEYYGITYDADNESTKGKAQIIIAKNRHGALDSIGLKWRGEIVKFFDFNHSYLEDTKLDNNTNFLSES